MSDSHSISNKKIVREIDTIEFLDKVYAQLVNVDRFDGDLSKVPHTAELDLAIVYYAQAYENGTFYTKTIDYEILDKLGVDEETLKEHALSNTYENKKAVLKPLSDITGIEDECSVYVLSNEDYVLGAITMFYPDLLSYLSGEFECDLCILPSSIHETLIIPMKGLENTDKLKDIVKHVNDNEVADNEILSYSVYRYSKEGDCLLIDN